jgi:hypothetical protein
VAVTTLTTKSITATKMKYSAMGNGIVKNKNESRGTETIGQLAQQ